MLRIGLISDTHSHLDPKAIKYLEEVDEIWHAGDIGEISVTDDLAKLKPVRGVYGNIDGQTARAQFPLDNRFKLEGLDIWMTHIGGYPDRYDRRVYGILNQNPPDIFICGHSHILKVMRDPKFNNMLVMNPGAVGIHGFHKFKTLLRFTLHQGKVTDLEAIELGKRGTLSK